jgi:perosamine synthetase
MISLATSDVNLKSYLNILDCLKTKRLGRGKYVSKFEEEMSDYFGSRHAIAVSNGTMADLVMLLTLKEIYPEKDEVILPAMTFVAHANAVVMAGLKPKFVDVTHEFTINWSKVSTNLLKTLCIFPVHLLGRFAKMPGVLDVPILEDCCEAMGGENYHKKFGTFGMMGSFSMFPSHTITTGEGGLIITDSDKCNEIARSIINHGKWRSDDFTFNYFGINAKMTNLQAAVGCSLVNQIDRVNRKRQENVRYYNQLLDNDFKTDAPHCYPIIFNSQIERDVVLHKLKTEGVEARKLMGCIPEYEFYKARFGDMGTFPVASKLANQGLFVPIHQNLSKKDIEKVCEVVHAVRR